MTIDELKKTATYRFVKELTLAFHAAGVSGEPVEIPLKAIMEAPNPDYLPIGAAIKTKFMLMSQIYMHGGHYGSMCDAMPGIWNMMALAEEDLGFNKGDVR